VQSSPSGQPRANSRFEQATEERTSSGASPFSLFSPVQRFSERFIYAKIWLSSDWQWNNSKDCLFPIPLPNIPLSMISAPSRLTIPCLIWLQTAALRSPRYAKKNLANTPDSDGLQCKDGFFRPIAMCFVPFEIQLARSTESIR
jgi:hypothetical protein